MGLARVAILTLALAALAGSLSAEVARAAGKKCTITGTNSAETLRGTNGPDVICARGGDDRVIALNARDWIRGGGGDDRLKAGGGRDHLKGGGGDDLLAGENAGDELDGGAGADELDGGAGEDGCEDDDPEDVLDTNCVSPYSVKRLEIAPAILAASTGPQQIQVTVELEEVEDWYGSLRRIYVNEEYAFGEPNFSHIFFPNPYPQLALASGTPEDGVWTGTYTVPADTAPGPHTLALLMADGPIDPLEFTQTLSAYDLMRAGLPFGFLVTP